MYPVLAIDDAHSQLQRPYRKPAPYELAPTAGVILDATSYQFYVPDEELKIDRPDFVGVLLGYQRQYTVEWKPENGKLVLDASTLRRADRSQPFTSFQSGDFVVLTIGLTDIEGNRRKSRVIWFATAKVT